MLIRKTFYLFILMWTIVNNKKKLHFYDIRKIVSCPISITKFNSN